MHRNKVIAIVDSIKICTWFLARKRQNKEEKIKQCAFETYRWGYGKILTLASPPILSARMLTKPFDLCGSNNADHFPHRGYSSRVIIIPRVWTTTIPFDWVLVFCNPKNKRDAQKQMFNDVQALPENEWMKCLRRSFWSSITFTTKKLRTLLNNSWSALQQ